MTTTTTQKTAGVKLLLLRDPVDSTSQEEASESLNEDESEEIDMLMDLIESESKDRDSPPVTTVRLIKQISEQTRSLPEPVAQHSHRKERLHTHPQAFKEYHIHYHNHQHKAPAKPMIAIPDTFHPLMWNTQLPVGDFDTLKQLQKASSVPYHHKVKSFSDFDSLVKNNLRSQFPQNEKIDPKIRLEAYKDFETLIKPRIPIYKTKQEPPYERMKKFQEFYDSEEERTVVTNENRFAGFKDFSELEKPEEPETDEKRPGENQERKTVKIKDFAIVIRSRPRKTHKIVNENNDEPEEENPGPQIPPFINKLNIPHDKIFNVPKLLDAAGGAPKYIDALNQLKYPQVPLPFPFNVNALEHERQKLLHMRAPLLPPPHPFNTMAHYPRRPPHLNNWLLRRFMKS